nr:chemotaxis protein CheD [Priestia taiwanensis]
MQTIRTAGLGSCVGIVIYDEERKIGGLAHIMLPDSSLTKGVIQNKAKYADTAIPVLLEKIYAEGGKKASLRAKIAGGAQMFQFSSKSDLTRIGPRNVEAVKDVLKKHHIMIVSEDVGGNKGRTIEFSPLTCKLAIRTVNEGTKEI